MEIDNQTSPSVMLQMITSSWIAQSVYAAAKLGIADLLKDKPRTSDELARETATHSPSLYRLMRSLAGIGIFAEDENRRFHLTPMAEYLRSDVPVSMRAAAIMCGEPWHWQTWGNILHTLKTGEPGIVNATGMRLFPFLEQNSEAFSIFSQCMTGYAAPTHAATVSAYDFSGIELLVDVGGGYGTHLAAILNANPNLRGVLFDQPSAADGAKSVLAEQGLSQRCEFVAGDFFQAVPAGGDAYLMSHILHDWDDQQSATILRNCRQAMKPNGRVLVVETVIPAGNEFSPGKLFDLEMMVLVGGLERTEAEYRRLFETAGFDLSRIISTRAPESIIEGISK
ncbi:MAG TPA: methyltransferase [Blastocatellia bacterium]|nr:methyltransferase [Blastocatellia bacterium]